MSNESQWSEDKADWSQTASVVLQGGTCPIASAVVNDYEGADLASGVRYVINKVGQKKRSILLAACWNAMHGIPSDNKLLHEIGGVRKEIVKYEIKLKKLKDQQDELLKQRDDLLTELKRMVEVFSRDGHDTEYEEGECIDIDIARAVIASVEGGAK